MKSIILLISSVLVFNAIAQDTTYYNSSWQNVESSDGAAYSEILFRDQLDTNKVQEFIYYASGQLKSEKHFSNYNEDILDGKDLWYFDNGQLNGERNYIKGKIDGVFKTYWKDGVVKRHDLFKNDSLIEGTCYDPKGEKVSYYDYLIPASFPNGNREMMKFLAKEMRYPENAIMNEIEGRVYVRFIVEKNGSVSEVKINRGVDEELDAEALRTVRKMPKWIPGRIDGEIVRMYFDLPVNFKLN